MLFDYFVTKDCDIDIWLTNDIPENVHNYVPNV